MNQRIKKLISVCFLLTMITGCAGSDQEQESIQGRIIYKDNVVLPPSAQITVQLLDTSTGLPVKLVSGQTFLADGNQNPFLFNLNYETQHINPEHQYILVSDIKVKNKLIFRTANTYSVLTDKDKTRKLDLLLKRN